MDAGKRMNKRTKTALSAVCVSALLAANAPALAKENVAAEDVFGDRGYALAIDDRCNLFTDAERAALEASYLQARGALLRGHYAPADLDAYRENLDRQADNEACDGSQANAVQLRVNLAFEGYQRLTDLNFPGTHFSWAARRPDPMQTTEWLIEQETDLLRAGLVRYDNQQSFTIALPNETLPAERQFSQVILVLRDTTREPELYDPTVGGLFPGPETAPWARWTPPDYARRFVWAAGRLNAEDLYTLTGQSDGIGYRFGENAAREIARRDPRETARIDFLDRRGQPVMSRYFEIGDFGAALAFLRAAPEPASAEETGG